ncbi:MAG: aminotransferase class-V family protein [Candidatus Xenolissoclinum pacificiensis L6]|uniref:Cysteine desulfurase n=1 Tax=Candidatus Xenolissoclinum pacificiensis L6 TaxID=1401685 RepID=W2UYX3_9RICK|nr:MAG: aminotransferase class-V family protein [Candidatus Xenolissoclinum pacificiensis L6]
MQKQLSNTRIYADCNATVPMLASVRESIKNDFFNPSTLYQEGRNARERLNNARQMVRNFLGQNYNIVFTASVTEAHNMLAHNFNHGITIISSIEHPSITNTLSKAFLLEVNQSGIISHNTLEDLLIKYQKHIPFVSIMLANHEIGVIQNISSLSKLVKKYGGIMHSDITQMIGKYPFDTSILDHVDCVTFAGHKIGAGFGAAVLAYRKHIKLSSLLLGGMQENGQRSGTENLFAINGIRLALLEIMQKNHTIQAIKAVRDYLEKKILETNKNAIIVSSQELRIYNTSCIIHPEISGEEQMMMFDINGIAVGTGSACSSGRITTSKVIKALGFSDKIAKNMIRISIDEKVQKNHIDKIIKVWQEMT